MCGIVGYIGERQAQQVIVEGLEKLEYRGYDSSGLAVGQAGQIEVKKRQGRLSELEIELKADPLPGKIGIGHTRWATHGVPSDENSHPHVSQNGRIAIVHNGIIENYQALKSELENAGVLFRSQTDSEVIVHLIDSLYRGDLKEAVVAAKERLQGAYALGVLCADEPSRMVAVRKESPLVVGIGEGENFIASDIPALLAYTQQICYLENDEMAVLEKGQVRFFDAASQEIQKTPQRITWSLDAASKDGFPHFMLKEIYEQPGAVRDTLLRRLDAQGRIVLDDIALGPKELKKIDKVYIIACGTAYYAGLVGRFAIERFAGMAVQTDTASEFRYRDPSMDASTLLIVISQSGETADTLAVMREARRKGARVLALTNAVGSTAAREANDVFYTWAGPEISVASTKAYLTQLTALYMIALYLGDANGTLNQEQYQAGVDALKNMPAAIEQVLDIAPKIKDLAYFLCDAQSAYYTGRGLDAATALEGALKLKEISYIHAEAISAGEFKHGPLALIQKGTPVIALATQASLLDKTLSNLQELKARGAYIIAIALESSPGLDEIADQTVYLPQCPDIFAPMLSAVPCQLIAYYSAVSKGNDVDHPRNLAKSVTVE